MVFTEGRPPCVGGVSCLLLLGSLHPAWRDGNFTWPKDSKTSVVRNGSRLNEILVVRLDPAELADETRSRAADGIVAYSAICSHAGCPITGWLKGASGDNDVFKCFCHNSEFDPRQAAQVVFGPAPRRLAALPLSAADGSLTVVATFVGKVGAQQEG
jgi:rieske iron-sulfur protein